MLRDSGIAFEVQPSAVDEDAVKRTCSAVDAAAALALAKARNVSQARPGALVLGCDQTLLFEGRLIDKSRDLAEAQALIKELRGKTHRLVSAAALVQDGETRWQGSQSVDLTMRAFDDRFLDSYLEAEGVDILACVGCYRLEGRGVQLFERIAGDYFAVLGLPLLPLLAALRMLGVLS